MQLTIKQLKEIKNVIEVLERNDFDLDSNYDDDNDNKIVEFGLVKSGTYKIEVKEVLLNVELKD